MANWSDLQYDILVLIAKRVKVMKDFVSFGAVCTSWRSAAVKDHFDWFSSRVPLLMLSDTGDDDYRDFYSISTEEIVGRIFLPEIRERLCFSSHGWLCVVHETTGEMSLLHPFSRTKIPLPPHTDLINEEDKEVGNYVLVDRVVISASPSLTSDYVVMFSYFGRENCLASWRPGQVSWTPIVIKDKQGPHIDINFCSGMFYSVTNTGEVWALDVLRRHSSNPQPIVEEPRLVAFFRDDRLSVDDKFYLVELSGALLLIKRYSTKMYLAGNKTFGFKIVELDVVTGKGKVIKSLGHRSIFLGINSTVSVESSKFSGIKPNCIYFTDDWWPPFNALEFGKDTGVYNVEDGSFQLFNCKSRSPNCRPSWITPSY